MNKCCDDWDNGQDWGKKQDCDKKPDCDEKKEECNIKSECCKGFVKQQFSIRATATPNEKTVYKTSNGNFDVAGTVLLTNLGREKIKLTVDNEHIYVNPNETGGISVDDIREVKIETIQTNRDSRALLCFDIQVPSHKHGYTV